METGFKNTEIRLKIASIPKSKCSQRSVILESNLRFKKLKKKAKIEEQDVGKLKNDEVMKNFQRKIDEEIAL